LERILLEIGFPRIAKNPRYLGIKIDRIFILGDPIFIPAKALGK